MSKPLRIALISEHASPLACIGGIDAGGQNIYVDHVARNLARRGHAVDVFTRRDAAELPPQVPLCPGARVIHIPAGPPCFIRKESLFEHMPEFMDESERFMRAGPAYDLVHANFFMSGMVAQYLRRRLGLPFVITFHALGLVRREHQKEADAFPAARIDIERSIVRGADAIVAECPQDWHDLTRLYDAPESRVTMVPCGFDRKEFSPMPRDEARAGLGLADDDFVVLQLGRLVPRKGIDNVIRALACARARAPQAKLRLLVVGGDGPVPDDSHTPEIARLRRVALAHGVRSHVRFVGHRQRKELRRYYAAADVFVTTPWYEPFGITPLEAMACRIPVIASEVGGLQYSVAHGETGYLVPPHDPHALAERILQLQRDPRLAAAMGQAGMRRVNALFTWERVVQGLLEVYASVRRPATAPPTRPTRAAAYGIARAVCQPEGALDELVR